MTKMPSLFISHGAPNMMLHGGGTHDFLQSLGKTLPKPKAIMVVSAHWETAEPMLSAHPQPSLIYDFYGFEPEMYKMTYPAAGSPAYAAQACAQIPLADIDTDRGLDHGVWSPLKIIYPDADIPVFEMSVQPHKTAADHFNTGEKLNDLSEQGVLIMASGNATHNLRAAFRGDPSQQQKAFDFADWLHRSLADGDYDQVIDWEKAAPDAAWNHPTPEHFLPIFAAMGAAGKDATVTRVYQGVDMGVLAMDAYRFG